MAQKTFAFSAEMAQHLDPIALRNIALLFILNEEPLEAWRLLECSNHLGELCELFGQLGRSGDHYGIDAADLNRLTLPFAPLVIRSLALDSDPYVVSHFGTWISQSKEFISSMAEHDADGVIHRQFSKFDFDSGLYRRKSHAWKAYSNALAIVPGLWETAISACLTDKTEPRAGRHGSPGLLLAAGEGSVDVMKRCLSTLENLGEDPAQCLAQSWPDADQYALPRPYKENNALSDALAAGRSDMARFILSINPKLDILREAKRVGEICSLMSAGGDDDDLKSWALIAANALALAESIALSVSVANPSRQKQAAKRHL